MEQDIQHINLDFHKKTFEIFEIDFMNAIKSILPKKLIPRDIYIIQIVKKYSTTKENMMTKIAKEVLMSPSKLSNNVDSLCEYQYLKRIKSDTDKRCIYVELDSKGLEVYQKVHDYMKVLLRYIFHSIGLLNVIKLKKIAHKINFDSRGSYKQHDGLNYLTENIITVYFKVIAVEDQLLEKKQFEITNLDLKILIYVFLLKAEDPSIKLIAQLFNDPFSTISSAVQILENKNLITKKSSVNDKRKKILTLTKEGLSIVSTHLELRKKIFDENISKLNDKERSLAFEVYQQIKEFVNNKKDL
ncbi:MAG: hypothetical protein WCR19_06545 [Acholeplasmataceae bacterium]